jgi:hypothetical protein
MLQTMPQTVSAAPSSASPTFAGMFAALASRPSALPGRTPAWDDSELVDDVATLSYERALRTHARYHVPEPSAMRVESYTDTRLTIEEAIPASAEPASAFLDTAPAEDGQADAVNDEACAADEGNRKSASITIRLSRLECEQLRKRAAEAGLTVSAYLRSCTVEAESLRAMVKDMLAQLRKEPTGTGPAHRTGSRHRWWRRLGRLWARPRAAHPA